MYAIKEAVIAKEHSHEPLDTAIFYMDMRTYGKDFERTYEAAKDKGIRFIRSRNPSMIQKPNGNIELTWISENGALSVEEFDLVVLSQGLEMHPETIELCQRIGVDLGQSRFVATSDFAPVASSRPGIYVCGAMAGPKDIPTSVMEASAAACAATGDLCKSRGTLITAHELPPQRDIGGERPKVGVFVCSCGINIAGVVDVDQVKEYAATLPNVEYVENNLFTCSQDTQDKMAKVIAEEGLNRIVVAACSPRTHEPLFRETLEAAGLNKYLFEQANIRNQDSWVHADDPVAATQKAEDAVRMAVAKASLLEPLTEAHLNILPKAMVIGGGVSGMNAALELAKQGFETHLVERDNALGGNARMLRLSAKGEDIQDYLVKLTARVDAEPLIHVHLGSTLKKVDGFVGNFETTLASDKGEELVEHGATIICIGRWRIQAHRVPLRRTQGRDDPSGDRRRLYQRRDRPGQGGIGGVHSVRGLPGARAPLLLQGLLHPQRRVGPAPQGVQPGLPGGHHLPRHAHLWRAGIPVPKGPRGRGDLHPLQPGPQARGDRRRRQAHGQGL